MLEYFEAHLPNQLYGYRRSDVKFMVANERAIISSTLRNLPNYLESGDLMVFNNSKLVPSSLEVYSGELEEYLTINIGTNRLGNLFLLEVRPKNIWRKLAEGSKLQLADESNTIVLLKKYETFNRYWWGKLLDSSVTIDDLLAKHGKFIRYNHIPFEIPSRLYEGIFYKIPGSVELPSASYAFDSDLVGRLKEKGIRIEEITLHCNLGSLEYGEFKNQTELLQEVFSVPIGTLRSVFDTRLKGNKVIAVGTTVVRALETLMELTNGFHGLRKLTPKNSEIPDDQITGTSNIFINRKYKISLIDGIITGMHESDGSHIRLLEAFQDREVLERMTRNAIDLGYRYHEFGDLALVFNRASEQRKNI